LQSLKSLFPTLSAGFLKKNPDVLISDEETVLFGRELAKQLPSGQIVAFSGDLGAGKTTMIKGIVAELTGASEESVMSPTFVLHSAYGNAPVVHHFDLYRLAGVDEFCSLGFEEMVFSDGVSCIEWPERIAEILPEETLWIHLSHHPEGGREVRVENHV